MDELTEVDNDEWTDKLEAKADKIENRLGVIEGKIEKRARFR